MIFLSTVMLLNFFRNNSLACLGVFGVSYYIACLYLKNKGLCLLAAIVVSTILFGCENNIEGLIEGVGECPEGEDCEEPESEDPEDPEGDEVPTDGT